MAFAEELARARARAAHAMAEHSQSPERQMVAGIQASLEHGMEDLQRNLPRLRMKLRRPVDAYSFVLASLAMGMAVSDVDIFVVLDHPVAGPVIRDYLEAVSHL